MKRLVLACSLLGSLGALAAPLVDLAGGDESAGPKEKQISQEDLVYTDNIKSDEALLKDAAQILFDVAGRKKPDRSGKIVHPFKKGDLVKILRESKDKRWRGVETLLEVKGRGKIRAWIPKNAVKPPESASRPPIPSTSEGGEPMSPVPKVEAAPPPPAEMSPTNP